MSAARIEWYDGAPPAAFAAAGPAGYPPEPRNAGARCAIAWRGDEPVARLATYIAAELHGAPGVTGMIGHYAARDDAQGVALLREAADALMAAGSRRVLGPIDGSTWSRYRLALPNHDSAVPEPPFLSEPQNPPTYPLHFEQAGFAPAALYESRVARDLSLANPNAPDGLRAMEARGIRIEALRMERFDDELRAIYDLSLVAFAENLYYSPIGWDEFRAMYMPLRERLDPDLVLLARTPDAGLAAFALAFPDLLAVRQGRPYRVVAKSMATAERWRGLGLGGLLLDEIRRLALAKGYNAIIHALIHVANHSRRISAHTTQPFRRYALYARVEPGVR